MSIIENIFDVIIFGSIISSVIGIKRPIWGGFAGMLIIPLLYYLFGSKNLMALLILIPAGFVLSLSLSFIISLIYSGLKGRGHNTGPSFMSGFGGGRGGAPSGGIILSDEERKGLKK